MQVGLGSGQLGLGSVRATFTRGLMGARSSHTNSNFSQPIWTREVWAYCFANCNRSDRRLFNQDGDLENLRWQLSDAMLQASIRPMSRNPHCQKNGFQLYEYSGLTGLGKFGLVRVVEVRTSSGLEGPSGSWPVGALLGPDGSGQARVWRVLASPGPTGSWWIRASPSPGGF